VTLPTSDDEASLEKIERAYDSPPWWYDVRGFFILTFAYRSTLWEQVRLFGNNIGPMHLEGAIGSGTLFGIILWWKRLTGTSKVIERVVGFDYAEAMLAGAIRRFRGDTRIRLVKADVGSLDLPAATFDTVNVANAVHCFPDVDAGFRELFRVMKPGGTFAMNVLLFPRGSGPFRWIAERIDQWGIKKGILYTPYELDDIKRRIVAAGFEIVWEDITGNTYNVKTRKPSR